jgi:hypothetical protein
MATNGQVYLINGQYYTQGQNPAARAFGNQLTQPRSQAQMDGYIKQGIWKPVSNAMTNQTPQIGSVMPRPIFTPNAFTQSQLGDFGVTSTPKSGLMNNMSTPQWMMDAYSRKIGGMGGNANAPIPFQVNQSGFPGMGGKTAPTQG